MSLPVPKHLVGVSGSGAQGGALAPMTGTIEKVTTPRAPQSHTPSPRLSQRNFRKAVMAPFVLRRGFQFVVNTRDDKVELEPWKDGVERTVTCACVASAE